MTAISTLCATGTVLVAPLGLTFARPQNDRPPPLSTPAFSQRPRSGYFHRFSNSQAQTESSSPASMTCFNPNNTSAPSPRPFTSSAGPPSAWDSNRSSIIRDEVLHNSTNAKEGPGEHHIGQRDSSSTTGHSVSRTHTYSSSSTQPFITPVKTPTQRPNKLVKRSLSQNIAGGTKAREGSLQRPLFRRPATSHQRSASWNLGLGQRADKPSPQSRIATPETEPIKTSEQRYIHFPRIVKVRKTLRGLSRPRSDRETDSVRHIQPDGSELTLVFAKSVIPAQVELEDSTALESDSDWSPASSPKLETAPTPALSPLNPSAAQSSLRSERHRRQSFSFFKPSPSRKLSSAHGPASKLKRKFSQRMASAPISSTAPMDESVEQPESQSPQQATAPASSPSPSSTPRPQTGHYPPTRKSSVKRHGAQSSTPTQLRHVSMSSPPSSSPDGSIGGQRVFSWGDGEEEGSTSETVYDSVRTGGTRRSSYGTARQPLETLFDKSTTTINTPPIARSPFLSPGRPGSQHTLSTDDRLSFVSAQATPQAVTPRRSPPESNISWSTPLDLGDDFADDEADWDSLPRGNHSSGRSPFLAARAGTPRLSASPQESGRSHTPRGDPGLRNSVFDWSEPTPMDKGSDNDTPPRPKTVHGKKGPPGAQSTTRRAQGGLHARSQSVPAFQDLTGRRADVSNKFGTWGVGGKGASEDWDDDFDFEQPSQSSPAVPTTTANNVTNNFNAMRIPDNIQRQQDLVLANIGLLKEWGLLIEELKDLRVRAANLDIRGGQNAKVFDEVDAMIDLADQEEHQDDALSTLKSPSSTQFSDDEQEGFTPPRALPAGQAKMSPSEMLRAVQHNNSVQSSPSFRFPDSPEPTIQRPRKDSEAVAQSVIEALQQGRQRKSGQEVVATTSSGRPKKMPFDTNTLKHIVPHVNGLMRQVKDLIRNVEGLHTSPQADRHSRPFGPSLDRAESPSAQREFRMRLQRSPTDKKPMADTLVEEDDDDLEEQLRKMDMG